MIIGSFSITVSLSSPIKHLLFMAMILIAAGHILRYSLFLPSSIRFNAMLWEKIVSIFEITFFWIETIRGFWREIVEILTCYWILAGHCSSLRTFFFSSYFFLDIVVLLFLKCNFVWFVVEVLTVVLNVDAGYCSWGKICQSVWHELMNFVNCFENRFLQTT